MINKVTYKGQEFVVEEEKDFMIMGYAIKEHLYSEKSDFQQVDVVDTKGHGKMLWNDKLCMISERDEFVYHEMMAHIPLFTHPNPKKVLVIGGGDGGTAREALRHKNLDKVVMVEIDQNVIDACKEHIPVTAKDLRGHERLELLVDDGIKYVKETDEVFDVVMVDSTDPFGPATPLFGPEFYKDVHNILSEDGIVVSQGESAWYYPEYQRNLLEIVNKQFRHSRILNFNNLTYSGGLWSFTWGSKKYDPIENIQLNKINESGLSFQYYNSDMHRAAFSLPTFMKEKLQDLIK